MAENTPITVYTAECIGNAANCLYPNEVKITDEFSAKLAFATDMVCARYKNNYRNTANFEVANALPGDCDNDHSDEPADWVTPEDIADLFADVSYVLHYTGLTKSHGKWYLRCSMLRTAVRSDRYVLPGNRQYRRRPKRVYSH